MRQIHNPNKLPVVFLFIIIAIIMSGCTMDNLLILPPANLATTSIVFEAKGKFTSAQLQETANTLQRRLNALGLDGNIQVQSNNQILVEVRGADDPQYVIETLQARGFMEFVDFSGLAGQVPSLIDQTILTDKQIELGLLDPATSTALRNPITGQAFHTGMTGACISTASAQYGSFSSSSNAFWMIAFEISPDCVGTFADFTQSLLGQPLAIVFDGRVLTAPTVQAQLSTGGIITGDRSEKETKALAIQLNSGILPVELSLVSANN